MFSAPLRRALSSRTAPVERTVRCRQLRLAPRAPAVRTGLSPPWLVHGHSAEDGAYLRYPYHCWCIPGAAWPFLGSAMSRTKVQGRILGKYHLGKDPFGVGAPQNCNTLAFTKLNQCFYKWDWIHRLDLLTVKLLSWWKGAESLCAGWLSPHFFPENNAVRAAEQILVLVLLCLEMLNRFGGSEF